MRKALPGLDMNYNGASAQKMDAGQGSTWELFLEGESHDWPPDILLHTLRYA